MEITFGGDTLITLLTLTFLEIVLGIDNIIFISIIVNKLPVKRQRFARLLGLGLALFFRIALLSTIKFLTGATDPLFTLLQHPFSLRDLILLGGGLFLLYKTLKELWEKIKGSSHHDSKSKQSESFFFVLIQIILIDIVFSFDSILTAVGLSKDLFVMISAVVISVIVMMLFSGAVAKFIHKYPTIQTLALVFLLLIGAVLVFEGFHIEIPKPYIYAALGFSLIVEFINIRIRKVSVYEDETNSE